MPTTTSTSLPSNLFDTDEILLSWLPDALTSGYDFINGRNTPPRLHASFSASDTTHRDRRVSDAVPQGLPDVPGEHQHHRSTFHADIFEQPRLSPNSAKHIPLPLKPQPIDPGLTAQLLPPERRATSPETPSPSTISADTISHPSPAKVGMSLQVVPYSPRKQKKKSEVQHRRLAKSRAKERKHRTTSSRTNALKTDTAPRTSVKRDDHGRIVGTVTVFGLNQIIRAPVSGLSQLATSITRRIGACPRCRQHRIRCDMPESVYQPCSQCVKLAVNFHHQPCKPISILDLKLHRKGPTLFVDLRVWVQGKQQLLESSGQDGSASLVFFLTQGFGEGIENALSVTVSHFDPEPGDRTTYHWIDSSGQKHSMDMPPYYISDPEAARQNIQEFLHNARSAYIHTLSDSNAIVWQTFQAALTYQTFYPSPLVSDALDSWVAARFIESHWRIFCGGAMVGLEPVNEPGHPWQDYIPVTPIMDTQLDDLVIRDLIAPLTERFLRRLKAKIDEWKSEDWLEIFFAIFIMMSNMGWTVKDMVANATWKGLKTGSRGGTLTQGYIHACKTMLTYFHFVCNGSTPISICCSGLSDRERENKRITRDQIEYLRSIQHEMSRHEHKLSNWKSMSIYDDSEIYWCFQMLSKGWRGDVPHAGEIDDYTELDFLSSSGA